MKHSSEQVFYETLLKLIDEFDLKNTLKMDQALIDALIYWRTGKRRE